jgi:6-phosphofructokinase 2
VDGPALVDDVGGIAERTNSIRIPDVVVFSGSLPAACPPATYAELAAINPDTFTVVDTSGAALLGALSGPVDLIKPSLRELELLTQQQIDGADALRDSLGELLAAHPTLGAVLVSLGAHGAVLGRRGEPAVRLQTPESPVVSAVGAGDSVVAGIAWGSSRGEDLLTACRLGVAAGTATVATPGTALCSAASALDLFAQVQVRELHSDDPIR